MRKFNDLSQKEKITLGLLIAASAVLLAILIMNYRGRRKVTVAGKTGKKETITVEEVRKPERMRKKKERPIEVEVLLQEVGREDPFLPSGKEYTPVGLVPVELNLTGITWDAKGRPLAIINDMIVGEGDMIGNKKVVKIEEKSVVIREDGKKYTLRLGGFKPRKEK